MKILFCSQTHIKRELGGSKPLVELSEELERLDWKCDFVSPTDFASPGEEWNTSRALYPERLRDYLHRHAAKYDVVDYDHEYLPYPRHEFDDRPLFVARSVLLMLHLEHIAVPSGRSLKARAGGILRRKQRAQERQLRIDNARRTIAAADLVNVTNTDDEAILKHAGVRAEKIVVLPFAISRERRQMFNALPTAPPAEPVIGFVGTFDYRKGANDFPKIVARVLKSVPNARFRLLGTGGMFQTKEEVEAHFPRHVLDRLEIVPRYAAAELPELLSSCSIGMFPSYWEGFPFGVLEMLAASLPVVAYNSPGAPMMLPTDLLVPPGDTASMSARLVALLSDQAELERARRWARKRSQDYNWEEVARMTSEVYLCCHTHRLRNLERNDCARMAVR